MPRKSISAAAKARRKKEYRKSIKKESAIELHKKENECVDYNSVQQGNKPLYSEVLKLNSNSDSSPVLAHVKRKLFTEGTTAYDDMETECGHPGKAAKRCETNEKLDTDSWPSISSVSILPSDSRMANVNQGDVIYGDAAGRQCMPTGYLAVALLHLDGNCQNWSGKTVEELIMCGSLMYQQYKPAAQNFFSVDDLPKSFIYQSLYFQQLTVQVVAGIIDFNMYNLAENCNHVMCNFMDLFQGLNVTGALFTMSGYTTAVLKDDSEYWVIDTHSRDSQGRPNANGKAGMFKFSDHFSLAKYLVNMSKLLSNSSQGRVYSHYELCRFDLAVTPTNTTGLSASELHDVDMHDKVTPSEFNPEIKTAPTSSSSCVSATPLSVKSEPQSDANLLEDMQTPVKQYSSRYARYYAENEMFRNRKRLAVNAKYKSDVQYRNSQLSKSREKYATDERHRLAVKNYSVEKYRDDEQHRSAVKNYSVEKYRDDEQHRSAVIKNLVEKYRDNEQHRSAVKENSRERYRQRVTKRNYIANAVEEFRVKSHGAPTSICCICTRLWFAEKVKVFKPSNYYKLQIIESSLDYYKKKFASSRMSTSYICNTCDSYVLKGKTPPQATGNNMLVCDNDPVFDSLNTLEQQLISMFIPFEKIVTLPRSKQSGMQGPVVCVPSDIKRTTNLLPVPSGESKIVPVYLKRRLTYRGHSNYKEVDTVKLNAALRKLKLQNPIYKDIEINENWNDIVDHDLLQSEHDSVVPDSDRGDEVNTPECGQSEIVIPGNALDSCLQSVDLLNDLSVDDIESISVAPGEGNRPVSLFHEPLIEAKSFPSLFPNGNHTYDAERDVKISRCDYYKARIFSADTRFAANTNYIFFAQYAYECEKFFRSIAINLRKGSDASRVNRAMLADPEYVKTLLKSDQGFKFFEPVRGSPEFWKKTMLNLFACLRNLGLPTFFVTLTSAELTRWTCHLGAILKQQGDYRSDEDILNMDYKEKCEVLKSNPVTAVQMFYHRVDLFFKLILLGPAEPLGKIKDFFYRVEFQARGAPHLHCLFWVEGAPRLDTHSHDEIVSFIDRYISARMPSESDDPELYEIVSSVQKHSPNHSASCRKGKTKKKCRFNFPKPCSPETFIVEPLDSDDDKRSYSEKLLKQLFTALESGNEFTNITELYSLCGIHNFEEFQEAMRVVAKKASVVLKRNQEDVFINNYNPDLLRAWNANIDVQYVLDPYSCIMYIISYIAKSENELGVVLKQAREEMIKEGMNVNEARCMRSLAHKYFTHREVSVQEAVVRLSGYKLKQFSRKVIFIPTNEQDVRMSKPLVQIMNNEGDERSGIWLTSIYDRYYARPKTDEFNDMCLARFVADYRILSATEAKTSKSPHKHVLGKGLGSIMKRTRSESAVIRYCKHSPDTNSEKYYLTLLKLFMPHRKANDTRPNGYETYESFFNTGSILVANNASRQSVSEIVRCNESKFNCGESQIDNGIELLQNAGELEDAWASVAPNVEHDRQQQILEGEACTENAEEMSDTRALEFEENSNQDQVRSNLCAYEMSPSTLKPMLQSMNTTQKRIFYHIRDWCIRSKNKDPSLTPFRLFVTGGAGVGKSHLINCVYGACTKILRTSEAPGDITILLLAPTGTAAHNINGQTIHSVFKIPVEHSRQYQPLSCDTLNTLRATLESVKIIIIDEVSMVGGRLLEYLDSRLRQIMGVRHSEEEAIFGNVSVLAVGDFYQLPPVGASPLVLPSTFFGNALFRDNFQLVELTEVMRQKDDALFANALNNLRIKKKEACMKPDIDEMLKSRVDQTDVPVTALHVFGTNAQVDNHNHMLVYQECAPVFEISAVDLQKNANGKLVRLRKCKKGHSSAIPDVLKVGVKARVMLMRNLDVDNGLVNGVFGTVLGFQEDEQEIIGIYVKFDDDKVGRNLVQQQLPQGMPVNTILLKRLEEPLKLKRTNQKWNTTRRQFPLKLGWAATIHKTQGMSVSQLVYDMEDTFAAGMAYVALSRVTALHGLYLRNYSPDKIYRDDRVYDALKTLSLLQLENISNPMTADIVVHNVQGLRSKSQDIHATYLKYASIMCFTETWLHSSHIDSDIAFDGFTIFRTDRRSTNCRGGVAIYVNTDIPCLKLDMPNNDVNMEIALLRLRFKQKSTLLACVYRPTSVSVAVSKNKISELLQMIEQQQDVDTVIVTGDLNENLINDENHPLYDLFLEHGYSQLVRQSTYVTGSLLDVVYVKNDIESVNASVVPVYFSDHEIVSINVIPGS